MPSDLVSGQRLGLVCASAGDVEIIRERLIEPMVNEGHWKTKVLRDDWTAMWAEVKAAP